MNNNNLIPQNMRTKSEQREIARMGGVASGEARRENKRLRDRLLWAAEQSTRVENNEPITYEDEIALQIVQKASAGDLKAARLYAELTGQLVKRYDLDAMQAPPPQIVEGFAKDL